MSIIRKHVFHSLFLICFILYVLSPFCYTENIPLDGKSEAYIPNTGNTEICVVWKLVFSKAVQNDDPDNGPPNVRFLLKKARAILKSDNIIAKPHPVIINPTGLLSACAAAAVSAHLQAGPHLLHSGYSHQFSGSSPPSV